MCPIFGLFSNSIQMNKNLKLQQIKTLKVNITSSMDVSDSQDYFSLVTRRRAVESSMFEYQLELYDLSTLDQLKSVGIYSSYSEQKHPCKIVAGDRLIVVAARNHIIFYGFDLEEKFKILHEQQNVYDLTASHDGAMVAMVGDNKILLWDTLSFRSLSFPFELMLARSCRFSYDNKYIGVSTTTTLSLYEIIPFGGSYTFEKRFGLDENVGFGTISSFEFNQKKSTKIVVGFSNISPRIFDFENPDSGLQVLFQKGEQPSYYNNYKQVAFLPDSQRVVSSDFTEGVGLWPGRPEDELYYRENYLFFGLKPFDKGRKVLGYVWQQIKVVEIRFKCPPGTKQFQQGEKSFKSSCGCLQSGTFWNTAHYSCESCLQNGINICKCPQGYKFLTEYGQCVLSCSSIPNTIKAGIILSGEEQSCQCKKGYSWQNGGCRFACANIPFAFEQSGQQSCTCIHPMEWNDILKICECPKFSTFNPVNPTFCECDQFHYPDFATGICYPDCTRINYVNMTDLTTAFTDPTKCQCMDGFVFSSYDVPGSGHISEGCVRDCPSVNGTLDGVYNIDSCKCEESTKWNNGVCQIDCGTITNAVKQVVDPDTFEVVGCACALNYLWVDENRQCGRDCTEVSFVNASGFATSLSCPCNKNFVWDYYENECLIDCQNINYTNEQYNSIKKDSCECRQAFFWDKNEMECIINCSQIWDAKKRVGPGECTCNGGKKFNSSALICNALTTEGVFHSAWVWGVMAALIFFTILVGIVMVKFCLRFASAKKNKQHNKKLKKRNQDMPKRRKKPKARDDNQTDRNTERMAINYKK